jgi:hypothetical protein
MYIFQVYIYIYIFIVYIVVCGVGGHTANAMLYIVSYVSIYFLAKAYHLAQSNLSGLLIRLVYVVQTFATFLPPAHLLQDALI